MAVNQPAPNNPSSSNSSSTYLGTTQVNVTEYEYIWWIKDFAKHPSLNGHKSDTCPLSDDIPSSDAENLSKITSLITSPTFSTVHGNFEYTWFLALQPKYPGNSYYNLYRNLYGESQIRWISRTPKPSPTAHFYLQINLSDSEGKTVNLEFSKYLNFGQDQSPWYPLSKTKLADYVVNGHLTIKIKMLFDDGPIKYIPMPVKSFNTNIDLLASDRRVLEFDDFERLLESGKFSDLTIVIENVRFLVHKNILSARSPVFSAIFDNECQEKCERELSLRDIEPTVMKELLRFIYAGKVQSVDQLDIRMFLAANRFGIWRLKEACEMHLIQNLKLDNLGNVLTMTNLSASPTLLAGVVDFMKSNATVLKSDERIKRIMSQLPSPILAKVIEAFMS